MKLFKISILIVSLVLLSNCGSTEPSNSSTKNNTSSKTTSSRNGERPDAASLMKQMDANNDGKLSESEVQGPLKEVFSKIDVDKDGFLSLEELEDAPTPQRREEQSGRPSRGGRQ